ncbi:hypothetical protein RA29_18110 [Tateyamaria sp. ANG-S1]|nr:hypothetical protein RA29_18110 [Tateyamaria sp. ANG-S1]
MGADDSLQERVSQACYFLLRSKGKYRDRLVDVSLELDPLRPEDFTSEIGPAFAELLGEIEGLRSGINVGFGHFNDPTPKQKDKIAKLLLQILKACSVAESLYDRLHDQTG